MLRRYVDKHFDIVPMRYVLHVATKLAGDYFGEMALVRSGTPRSAWVRAEIFIVLQKLTFEAANDVLWRRNPDAYLLMLKQIAGYGKTNLQAQATKEEEEGEGTAGAEVAGEEPGAEEKQGEDGAGTDEGMKLDKLADSGSASAGSGTGAVRPSKTAAKKADRTSSTAGLRLSKPAMRKSDSEHDANRPPRISTFDISHYLTDDDLTAEPTDPAKKVSTIGDITTIKFDDARISAVLGGPAPGGPAGLPPSSGEEKQGGPKKKRDKRVRKTKSSPVIATGREKGARTGGFYDVDR